MIIRDKIISSLYYSIGFVISPLFCIPIYIKGIKQRKEICFYFLCLVFAIFGAYYPPFGDAYRYREIFYAGEALDWSSLYLAQNTKDWLFWYLSYLFCDYINFDVFRFLLTITCYFLYTWMFFDIVKRNQLLRVNNTAFLLAWFSILFSLQLLTINQGIRFGVAGTWVVVAIYLLSIKKGLKGILLFAAALAMHFSVIILIPIVFFGFISKYLRLYKKLKISVVIVLIIFFNSHINSLLNNYGSENELLASSAEDYISGYWATALFSTGSVAGIIFVFIKILPIFPLAYYFFKSNENTFLSSVAFGGLLFLCISLSSISILGRYSLMFIPILFICLLVNFNNNIKQLKICLFCFVLVFCSSFYGNRKQLLRGYQLPALIFPLPFLYDSPYTDTWVSKNVSFNGDLK